MTESKNGGLDQQHLWNVYNSYYMHDRQKNKLQPSSSFFLDNDWRYIKKVVKSIVKTVYKDKDKTKYNKIKKRKDLEK